MKININDGYDDNINDNNNSNNHHHDHHHLLMKNKESTQCVPTTPSTIKSNQSTSVSSASNI